MHEASAQDRGRRECRVLAAPAASRAKLNKAHERSHHRFRRFHPTFPAQWFYGLLRGLPGEPGFLATVACASYRRLDTSVGVSERHDFAVRLGTVRQTAPPRPLHPAPRP
jgi:hypothetical protein